MKVGLARVASAPVLFGTRRPPLLAGVVAGTIGVAIITAALFALREVAPAVSLGVVYLVAVLLVASGWGLVLGAATSVASALAFNFFHIPPTGRLSISESENWVALVVFLVAAVITGTLADVARARASEADDRRREADLAAELARVVLGSDDLQAALAPAAQRVAAAFGLPSAAIVLDEDPPPNERRTAVALQGGWLLLPATLDRRVRERVDRAVVPTLDALLGAARSRARLLHEVVETRALRRSEDIKTTLLRAVSHDLRSPLTAVVASADALAGEHLDDEDRRELAAGIAAEGRRLAHMVDDLLDLTRLEAGRAEPRRTWIALDEVLDTAAEGLDRSRLELRLDPDLPMLHADAAQLERALHNLLDNALRHSGDEPVRVRAAAVGARLRVRITDRGPGVPITEQERIFQPFYRAPVNGTRSIGSGLGLAIVRGFVEANGGTVSVESLPDQGATFVVALPLVEGAR